MTDQERIADLPVKKKNPFRASPEKNAIYRKRYLQKNRWMQHHKQARLRCRCKSQKGYKRYGGRGIEFHLTPEDAKRLWERDKAATLRQPSLDRIDNDGHYTFENCRFIEFAENAAPTRQRKTVCRRGHSEWFVRPNDGKRRCLVCALSAQRESYHRRMAQRKEK